MSQTLPPTAHDPAVTGLEDRYGTGRRASFDRRFGWGAVIVLLLAGLVFLFWSGWEETGQVEFQDIGTTVESSREVTHKFTVTGPSEAPLACALEALSTSKGTIGWSIVEIPVTEARSHTVTTTLRTTTEATAATVKACWIIEE